MFRIFSSMLTEYIFPRKIAALTGKINAMQSLIGDLAQFSLFRLCIARVFVMFIEISGLDILH